MADSTGRVMTPGLPDNGQGAKAPLNPDPLQGPNPPATADKQPKGDLQVEQGASGTVLVHGILSNVDYLHELSGTQRIKIFDEMRKGDPTVRLGLMAVKFPLLAAKWYIKPPEIETKKKLAAKQQATAERINQRNKIAQQNALTPEQPPSFAPPIEPPQPEEEDEITTFVKNQLFYNPNFSWTSFLHQALLFCDYGNSFFEKVFIQTEDGKIGWRKFAQRLPQTVYRYTFQDGVTPGITQILPTGGVAEIPQWKLLMFVNEIEGSNYEGMSLLRAIYKPWYYKDTYYKIDAIATERQGMGIPVITAPPGATPEDKAKAIEVARNMRANEQAYLNLPEGFKVEYLDPKAKELKDSKEMILHHDRSILKGFLAHFLDLGSTSTGSFALSDNQSELFLQSLKYLAKIIQDMMQTAIRELVDLNFTVTDKIAGYPTLEYGSIGQVDVDKYATALFRLAQGGLISPDEDLERHIRNMYELPEATQLSEDDHDDPASATIPVPDINSSTVQIKKPIRYSPASGTQASERHLHNLVTLEQELAGIIQAKETA